MGLINKILPIQLKPFSRKIGFEIRIFIYKIKKNFKKKSKSPIFILGNQKSGTSVIASLLGEMTQEKTSVDLLYSGYKYNLLRDWKSKKIDTKKFISKNLVEFSAKIIKEPHLSVFFDELLIEYPKSNFIMVIRNPFDNIRSILDRLKIEGNINKLNENQKSNFFHSWNLLLNNEWIGGDKSQYIEVLAERWNIITNTFLQNNDKIILIKYEDFIKNKINEIENLSIKLNLENKNSIEHLLKKQYQPKGKNKNVDLINFYGKENYEKIKNICNKNMIKLGYHI
tara:strand:+ start:8334 stop:9182 length:849 start_codon:yes stop_codon:yes gene_type:complete